ncbi:MAG: AmmeMemoRadiSam system protein A [Bacteroidales bacterium]|nr:AmmeMemoRadiSam system protein A [Bacteroidales bacterium]MBN2758293.1 AmmeMemoRadiSam system protein A [Bacteroidales bacterium]
MYKAKTSFAKLAIDTIFALIKDKDISKIKTKDISTEFMVKLACFVSIHMKDGSLRSCIGTIEPREENLYLEIISNAVSASTKDSRFSPLKIDELDNIVVSVDVLSKPEIINNISELNPKKYGVIVTDGAFNRGVLLPDIEGINTIENQLNIVKRKAGLSSVENKFLKIYSFTSTRYH